jgi:hypothetical protein
LKKGVIALAVVTVLSLLVAVVRALSR